MPKCQKLMFLSPIFNFNDFYADCQPCKCQFNAMNILDVLLNMFKSNEPLNTEGKLRVQKTFKAVLNAI